MFLYRTSHFLFYYDKLSIEYKQADAVAIHMTCNTNNNKKIFSSYLDKCESRSTYLFSLR